jgi:uncharacterized protein
VTQEPVLPLWVFIIGGLVGAVFVSALLGGAAQAVVGTFDDLRVMLAGQVGLWLGLVPAVHLAARHIGEPFRGFAGFQMRWFDIFWAALGPILQVLIGLAYAPFVSSKEVGEAAERTVALAKGQVGPYLLLCVATVVGAPIVEELFFRGLVVRASRHVGTVFAIAVSGLLFAAVHLQPLLFPALACFGAVCALLTVKFARLGPSIWLHVGFNAATMATLAWRVFR